MELSQGLVNAQLKLREGQHGTESGVQKLVVEAVAPLSLQLVDLLDKVVLFQDVQDPVQRDRTSPNLLVLKVCWAQATLLEHSGAELIAH